MNQRVKMDTFLDSPLGRAILLELLGISPWNMADAIGFELKQAGGRPVPLVFSKRPNFSVKFRFKNRLDLHYAFNLLVQRSKKWFVPRKFSKRIDAESIPAEQSLSNEQRIVLHELISDAIRDRWSALEIEVNDPVALLRGVGQVTEHYPWGFPWHELPNTLEAIKNSLQPVAEIIAGSSEIDWWWSAMAESNQRWLSVNDAKLPTSKELVSAISRNSETIEMNFWWISPIDLQIPRTTRGPISSWLSVSLLCPGGPEQIHPESLKVWEVQVPVNASIYEVQDAKDWIALVERFPRHLAVSSNSDWSRWTRQTGPWILPDWKAISEKYDGVHISIAGYITAAYQALPVRDSFTILTGWRLDETLWLGEAPTAIRQLA